MCCLKKVFVLKRGFLIINSFCRVNNYLISINYVLYLNPAEGAYHVCSFRIVCVYMCVCVCVVRARTWQAGQCGGAQPASSRRCGARHSPSAPSSPSPSPAPATAPPPSEQHTPDSSHSGSQQSTSPSWKYVTTNSNPKIINLCDLH